MSRRMAAPAKSWLERNTGPTHLRLMFLAEDLRTATTRSKRLELALAIEQLATEVLKLEHPLRGQPGSRDRFGTWRAVALVQALRDRRGVTQLEAVKAIAGDDKKARARIERSLRKRRATGKPHLLSFSEREYEATAARLLQTHRIK